MTLFRAERRADHPTDNLTEMFRRRLGPAVVGRPVTKEAALSHSAVYACVDKIVSIVSAFPVDVYRRSSEGTRIPSPTPYPVVIRPSTELDGADWRAVILASWLLQGNAFGIVTLNGSTPTSVELISPDRVAARRTRRDAPTEWTLDGNAIERWPDGLLWHAPGKVWDPASPFGVSVLEYARNTAGLGLATQRFGSDFFTSGGHPTGLVTADGNVNEDMAKRVKLRFLEALGGGREPVVMGGGWKYQQVQVAPNESQFLETIKANATDIARFFGVPATIIDAPTGTGMTYNNASQKADDLLRFTINGWVLRLERVLNGLVNPPDFVKLNVDSLLRLDLTARYLAYDRGIRDGFLSVNEARRTEDLPPIPDGDTYLWPPYRAFPIDSDEDEAP